MAQTPIGGAANVSHEAFAVLYHRRGAATVLRKPCALAVHKPAGDAVWSTESCDEQLSSAHGLCSCKRGSGTLQVHGPLARRHHRQGRQRGRVHADPRRRGQHKLQRAAELAAGAGAAGPVLLRCAPAVLSRACFTERVLVLARRPQARADPWWSVCRLCELSDRVTLVSHFCHSGCMSCSASVSALQTFSAAPWLHHKPAALRAHLHHVSSASASCE